MSEIFYNHFVVEIPNFDKNEHTRDLLIDDHKSKSNV